MSEQAVTVTVRLSDSHHARKRDTSHWLGLSNCKREEGWMIWNFQEEIASGFSRGQLKSTWNF